MPCLIVYRSYHRMNTEKVAREMGEAVGTTLTTVEGLRPEALDGYDLVGFGSGIYGGRHHRDLLSLVDQAALDGRDVFIFSTAGGPAERHHQALREALIAKGCRIVGEFRCPGEFRILRFITRNEGHPDEQDLENARQFATGIGAAQASPR